MFPWNYVKSVISSSFNVYSWQSHHPPRPHTDCYNDHTIQQMCRAQYAISIPLRSNSNDMQKLLVPWTHNKLGDRSFSATGPRLWNDLPPGYGSQDLHSTPSDNLWKLIYLATKVLSDFWIYRRYINKFYLSIYISDRNWNWQFYRIIS